MKCGFVFGDFATAQAVFFLGEDDDGTAFGGFVGEAGEVRGVGQLFKSNPGEGDEFDRLTIA